jgi:tRNA(Ile)-lysidine synthase
MSDQLYRNALGLGGLDVEMLKKRHPAVVKNLLRNNLDKLDCLSKDNIEAIYRALSSSQYKRQLSATVFCRIKDGRLSFYSPQKSEMKEELSYTRIQPGQTVVFGDYTLHFSIISPSEHKNITENNKNYLTYGINYDILKGDVGLRTRKTGDKFSLVNRNVTKTLKKLFIEDKVPQAYRDRIPVLVDETDSVVWVGEYGTSQPFVPTDDTKEILLITQM